MANVCLEFFPDEIRNRQIIRLFCSLGTYLSFPALQKKKSHQRDTNSVRVGKKSTGNGNNLKIACYTRGSGNQKVAGGPLETVTTPSDLSETLSRVITR